MEPHVLVSSLFFLQKNGQNDRLKLWTPLMYVCVHKKENIHTEKNAKFTYLCFLSIFHSDVINNICAHFFCQKKNLSSPFFFFLASTNINFILWFHIKNVTKIFWIVLGFIKNIKNSRWVKRTLKLQTLKVHTKKFCDKGKMVYLRIKIM